MNLLSPASITLEELKQAFRSHSVKKCSVVMSARAASVMIEYGGGKVVSAESKTDLPAALAEAVMKIEAACR